MCASPLSPRHAQPDWMGGGLVSRQMMHAPPSAAISLSASPPGVGSARTTKGKSEFGVVEEFSPWGSLDWKVKMPAWEEADWEGCEEADWAEHVQRWAELGSLISSQIKLRWPAEEGAKNA